MEVRIFSPHIAGGSVCGQSARGGEGSLCPTVEAAGTAISFPPQGPARPQGPAWSTLPLGCCESGPEALRSEGFFSFAVSFSPFPPWEAPLLSCELHVCSLCPLGFGEDSHLTPAPLSWIGTNSERSSISCSVWGLKKHFIIIHTPSFFQTEHRRGEARARVSCARSSLYSHRTQDPCAREVPTSFLKAPPSGAQQEAWLLPGLDFIIRLFFLYLWTHVLPAALSLASKSLSSSLPAPTYPTREYFLPLDFLSTTAPCPF